MSAIGSCVNATRGTQLDEIISELAGEASCGSMKYNANCKRDDLKFRLIRLLEKKPHMSHRQMAQALGVSAGSVNYCINALIEKGLVKVRNFRENGNRLRYLYLLTPKGASAKLILAHDFLVRKAHEYKALRDELDAVVSELDELNYGKD